ncbi:MAG: hypothetical protein RI897_1516 [Verrucomicrobiota bacterium]
MPNRVLGEGAAIPAPVGARDILEVEEGAFGGDTELVVENFAEGFTERLGFFLGEAEAAEFDECGGVGGVGEREEGVWLDMDLDVIEGFTEFVADDFGEFWGQRVEFLLRERGIGLEAEMGHWVWIRVGACSLG